jgi:hypothetical protein
MLPGQHDVQSNHIICSYHNGNDLDKGQLRGFGHIGFLVDDLDAACAQLEAAGVAFKKKPQDGTMRGTTVLNVIFYILAPRFFPFSFVLFVVVVIIIL